MKFPLLLATIGGLCCAGAEASDASSPPLHFLVMGDWGGLPGPIYTTPAEKDTYG
jgi:hypothetical protein